MAKGVGDLGTELVSCSDELLGLVEAGAHGGVEGIDDPGGPSHARFLNVAAHCSHPVETNLCTLGVARAHGGRVRRVIHHEGQVWIAGGLDDGDGHFGELRSYRSEAGTREGVHEVGGDASDERTVLAGLGHRQGFKRGCPAGRSPVSVGQALGEPGGDPNPRVVIGVGYAGQRSLTDRQLLGSEGAVLDGSRVRRQRRTSEDGICPAALGQHRTVVKEIERCRVPGAIRRFTDAYEQSGPLLVGSGQSRGVAERPFEPFDRLDVCEVGEGTVAGLRCPVLSLGEQARLFGVTCQAFRRQG